MGLLEQFFAGERRYLVTVTIDGLKDGFGKSLPSSTVNLRAYITGGLKTIRDASGSFSTDSTRQLILEPSPALSPSNSKFTIPEMFATPRVDVKAIAINMISDETGPVYQEVYLP
jgi:hypothetical protein